jgi:hypothetical protein
MQVEIDFSPAQIEDFVATAARQEQQPDRVGCGLI